MSEPVFPPWIVFHVPHDATVIPAEVRDQFLLDDAQLAVELVRMTDHHTLDLITQGVPAHQVVRFPVSRLVVDVERFEDDNEEPMSARGLGVVYAKTHELQPLRRPLMPDEREHLLERWYRPHHRALCHAVDLALEKYGRALVVDVHSFPARPLPYETDPAAQRPEICVGTDSFHTSQGAAVALVNCFEAQGFETAINTPFAGAMVPAKHYGLDKRVMAIMIEVRRDLYLDESTGFLRSDWQALSMKLRQSLCRWINALPQSAC